MNHTAPENPESQSDEQLACLSIENIDFFYWLLKRYEFKILNYIQRISGVSRQCAEDIAQEVFLKVYKSLNAFNSDLKFSSWIYRIAHNETVSYHRKNRSDGDNISLDNEANGNLINFLKSSLDIKQEAIDKETSEKVRQIINSMPFDYREVLVLKYLEEKEYKEIEDILRKPAGTVATLLNRAKKYFKQAATKQHLDNLT